MSLDERSESLRIRTSNGVEKQVRIIQDPGMIFFPTMKVYGIQVGQGEKKFAPLNHYPVISLVINIGSLLSSLGVIAFRFLRNSSLMLIKTVLPMPLRIREKN